MAVVAELVQELLNQLKRLVKQEELQNLAIRHEALTRQVTEREAQIMGNSSTDANEKKEEERKAARMRIFLI